MLYHASQVATSTCHGDDFFAEASLEDWTRSKQRYVQFQDQEACCRGSRQRQRGSAFSNARHAGWSTNVASRGLLIRLRLNQPSTCATWTVRERKGVTSPAVKDSRWRDGGEPVNGVLGHLATDRLDVQYAVKNLTREVSVEHDGWCGTLYAGRISHGHFQPEPSEAFKVQSRVFALLFPCFFFFMSDAEAERPPDHDLGSKRNSRSARATTQRISITAHQHNQSPTTGNQQQSQQQTAAAAPPPPLKQQPSTTKNNQQQMHSHKHSNNTSHSHNSNNSGTKQH